MFCVTFLWILVLECGLEIVLFNICDLYVSESLSCFLSRIIFYLYIYIFAFECELEIILSSGMVYNL